MNELIESLLKCNVVDNVVHLPPLSDGPLPNYNHVRTSLMNAGGKYKKNTFVFSGPAQPIMDKLTGGEKVNLKKECQFFPTPAKVALKMIDELPYLEMWMKVLEPSAGDGAILKQIMRFDNTASKKLIFDCYELMDINQEKLKQLSYVNLMGTDFLKDCIVQDYYDVVIANPPFTNNQDIDHIYKMYEVLKPGGTLVTLASTCWYTGSQKKQKDFRDWLNEIGVEPVDLERGDFKESGTMIQASMLVIKKEVRTDQEEDDDLLTEKVTTTIGKYNYNENGVCMNPDTVFELKTKHFYCNIEISENKKGFVFGYNYGVRGSGTGTGGSGSGAWLKGNTYEHRDTAILQAAHQARNYFQMKKKELKDLPVKELKPLEDLILDIQNGRSWGDKLHIPEGFSHPDADKLKDQAKAFVANRSKQSPSIKNKTTMLQSQLQVVPLKSITISDSNKLLREPWEMEPDALKELSESIAQKGVIQPVVLRPNGKPNHYFLVCGERRFHASLIAGLKDIPALIKELTDEEAFDLQITENLQRKDVHPMKEAQAYQALIESNPEKNTITEMAHRFGKSGEYIAQRLSFNNLITEMRKEFAAGKMLIGHAILFARLQEDDQRDCMVNCKPKFGPSMDMYESVKMVETYIMQKLVREIKKACFNENDKELVPAAGSCHDCTKRSGNNELFADVKEKDRCFDGTCYQLKTATYLINKLGELKEDNPNIAVIASGHGNKPLSLVKKYMAKNKINLLVEYNDYETAAKSDKGAIKALVVAGNDVGEIKFIRLRENRSTTNVSAAKGAVAKNTVEHYDELINQEKQLQKDTAKELMDDVQQELVNRATELKPYEEPDNTPLDKYEMALLYRQMVVNDMVPGEEKKVMAVVRKIPVDKSLKKEEAELEAWTKLPQSVINYIFRCCIRRADIETPNTVFGIGFRKAVGKWKGVNLEAMEKDAQLRIEKAKVASDARIAELQAKKKELGAKKPAAK